MFYLLIDIHQLSQLLIIEPEKSTKLVGIIKARCEKWGTLSKENTNYFIYTYRGSIPDEYRELVQILFVLKDILSSYEDILHGYNLILEKYDEREHLRISLLTLKIRERWGLYLGENAASLMSHLFSEYTSDGLLRISDMKPQDYRNVDNITHWIIRHPFFEKLFDQLAPWINGKELPGEVHISGDECNGIHLVGSGIIHYLCDSDAQGKCMYAVIEEAQDLLPAIARSINMRKVQWVEDELSETEKIVWREKRIVLWNHYPEISSSFPTSISEKTERDMSIALQIYLYAHSRRSYARGTVPLVIIYCRRKLSADEQLFLTFLMKSGKEKSRLFWFFIGEKEYVPSQALALESIFTSLNIQNKEEIYTLCKKHKFSDRGIEYVFEISEQKLSALYHILNNKEYFIKIPPSRLRNFGRSAMPPSQGIIQRSLSILSDAARELLYFLMLFGPWLSRDQVFAFFHTRERSHTETAELYRELRKKGYIFHTHNIAFTDVIIRLAHTYSQTGLIPDTLKFIFDPGNAVRLQDGLINVISKLGKHQTYLPATYRYAKMLIDHRQYARAQQIAATALNRETQDLINAEITLEAGGDGEAGAARGAGAFSKIRIPRIFSGDNFWKEQWLIIQTGLHIQEEDIHKAKHNCKETIILAQQLNDEQSLCQANNIFGYLYHRLSRHQEACYYFSIVEKNNTAGECNRIFAQFMSVLNNFVRCRYSDVKHKLTGDHGLLARLTRTGQYSWVDAASFLMARTYFALGEYQKAQITLTRQLNVHRGFQAIHELFYVWIARCFMYRGMFKAGMKILKRLPQTSEVILFTAESFIMRGQFSNALTVLRQEEEKPKRHPFSFMFTWKHGFSWIEDLLVSDPAEDSTLINFRYAITAFAMGKNGNTEESIKNFHWLTREKKISSTDPHLSIILYWYFCMLEQSSENENKRDWLTTLSRAVKILQERSNNIDEPMDKRLFLKNSIWNNKLFNTAKHYNLI